MSDLWNVNCVLQNEAAFQAADAVGKRVMIAKDVIASINAEKIEAATGVFAELSSKREEVEDIEDLRGAILHSQSINSGMCTTCGLGALFVCLVLRDNKIGSHVLDEYNGVKQGEIFRKLEEFFDPYQVRMIEAAFECGQGVCGGMGGTGAREFGRLYEDDSVRMIAIMVNIIQHDGEFKPF